MAHQLNYEGAGEVLHEKAAFSARRKSAMQGTWMASGDYLYRIFPTPDRTFFIKLDSGTDQAVAFAGGVLGLAIWKMITKNKKKADVENRLASFEGQKPAHLLAKDPNNHVLPRAQMTEMVIDGPSMWNSVKFGSFTFRDGKKKKRTFLFEDVQNFRAAVNALHNAFGDQITIRAEYDPAKNKIRKIKA
jgi:hypothetical protein